MLSVSGRWRLDKRSASTYRIIIADDHELLRQGIRSILSARRDFEVVGEASNSSDLLCLMNDGALCPHMVILDISTPRQNSLEAARKIDWTHPQVKMVALCCHRDKEYLRQAIICGAEGCVLKEDVATDLIPAIDTVMKGGIFISPALAVGRIAGAATGRLMR